MWRRWLLLCVLVLPMVACAKVTTPSPTPIPKEEPTPTPQPTATSPETRPGEVEGLVMTDNGQLIVGVNWLSKSRVTYRVVGGEVESLHRLIGETVRVQGEIVDHSLWLKEITVRAVQPSAAANRLSMRRGFLKELGPSIYMQGTHILVDREGTLICLLSAPEGGPNLDEYARYQVVVIGVMEKTVEGNAQIMRVQSIEVVK